MSAEIFTTVPKAGDFTEKHFGEHFNHKLWVKFTDNNFEDWIGCFSQSFESGFTKILVNNINTRALVIAGGQGYLINISNKALILEFEEHPLIESAITTNNPDYFVAGTYYSLYIIDQEGLKQTINPNQQIDGIYLKEQRDNIVIGDLATAENQYSKNVDFEFDLTNFEFRILREQGLIDRIWKKITN